MRNIPIVTKNLLIVNVVAFLACMLMDKSMGGGSGLTDVWASFLPGIRFPYLSVSYLHVYAWWFPAYSL